jgi:hypothetical protein
MLKNGKNAFIEQCSDSIQKTLISTLIFNQMDFFRRLIGKQYAVPEEIYYEAVDRKYKFQRKEARRTIRIQKSLNKIENHVKSNPTDDINDESNPESESYYRKSMKKRYRKQKENEIERCENVPEMKMKSSFLEEFEN